MKETDSRTDESCSCPQESLVEIEGKLTGKAIDRHRPGLLGYMATYQSDDLYRCRDCGQYWLFQYWEVVTPDNQFEEWGDTNSVWTPLTLEQRDPRHGIGDRRTATSGRIPRLLARPVSCFISNTCTNAHAVPTRGLKVGESGVQWRHLGSTGP